MGWIDGLRAVPGEAAVLALVAGAGLAALGVGRIAVAIGLVVSLGVAALSVEAVWRASPATAFSALIGAIAAFATVGVVAAIGPDAHPRRRATQTALALLAGAGLAFAASTPSPAFAVLGLWLSGLAGVGLIAIGGGDPAADDAGRWLSFIALTGGLALLGVALQSLAGGGGRLAALGWTLHVLGLLGLAGLAPLNGLQVRLAGLGGPGVVLTCVATPSVALGLGLRELALEPAEWVGLAAGTVAVAAAGAAVVQMTFATDLRRALAGVLAAQASICLAAGALAIASGARAGAEAAGLALMAFTLGGVAGFCALDALSPGRAADPDALRGQAGRAPFAAAALAVALVGFMGAPLTFAFLGRWLTLGAALQHGWAMGAAALIVTALATTVLGARWLAVVFGRAEPAPRAANGAMGAALAGLAAACLCLAFGLAADWPLGVADLAFAVLTQGGGR